MNYLQWLQLGGEVKYIEGTNLPSTGDAEKDAKLLQVYLLQSKDQPLDGTDPIGEFYVSGVALGPVFSVVGKGISFLGKSYLLSSYLRPQKIYRNLQVGLQEK